MQNSESDGQTALTKAAGIPASPSLITSLLRAAAQQPPLQKESGSVEQPAIDPRVFQLTEEGSGAFGRWILDSEQLPAYRYEMDQRRDVRAYYLNTEGRNRRDHWHFVGNDRITALTSNDGDVQVFLADHGIVCLNRSETDAEDEPTTLVGYFDVVVERLVQLYGQLYHAWVRLTSRKKITPRAAYQPSAADKADEARNTPGYAFGGGFGYLNDGEQTWATAYRYSPKDAEKSRVFGIGYHETMTNFRDIHQTRRVFAPYGNDPIVLAEVEIENRRKTAVDLRYYEYWDVNVHQFQIEWIRTGLAAPVGDSKRSRINVCFTPSIAVGRDPQTLRFHQEFRAGTSLDGVDRREVDTHPADVFLANLNEPATAYYVDSAAFFGSGGVRQPDVVEKKLPGAAEIPELDDPMPYCMALRHDVHLEPGGKITLRYGYGAVQPGSPLDFVKKYSAGDWLKQTRQAWKDQLPYFSTGSDPVLQRETTWHAYNQLAATLYSEYFDAHYTPQGSAYLFLHGAEGVPRDQSLFSIPLVYIRPALARELLLLLLSLRDADTLALPYGFVGNGAAVKNTLGFHAYPSDLDLFILLAISEYLSATGDLGFLDAKVPLYHFDQRPAPISVLDHIRAAVQHLDKIGVGSHHLLKIGDGDWDDAIVIMNVLDPFNNVGVAGLRNTINAGESVPNSQMALHVLPLMASIIDKRAPDLAAHMRDITQNLKTALQSQWNTAAGWYYRAYLRDLLDQPIVIGDHHISLQSQVWPLISGLAAEMKIEQQLVDNIRLLLDDPSPTGATLESNGQVWPAISQLLTWGYRRHYPDLAWRSLNRQTFASHATVFPNIWYNIWSGPDATNGKGMPYAGGTWTSPVTPMTDFPAMNANQDALALLALIRVCGVEPSMQGDGLDIVLKSPPDRFVLDTQLLRLELEPGSLHGEYRAVAAGTCTLHVYPPPEAVGITASLGGQPLTTQATSPVDLPLKFTAGQKLPFEVSWQIG